jgi:hypothetical protein
MDEEIINKLNLEVLRRLDHEINFILYRTRYAALHELDRASKIWHACEKAGPLFIVNRNIEPYFKFFLLNQKNNIDYAEEIFESMKIEVKQDENFLFFETKKGVIQGLWVSEGDDLFEIDGIINHFFKK